MEETALSQRSFLSVVVEQGVRERDAEKMRDSETEITSG